MKNDLTIQLVDIARTGAILAGAEVKQTAEEIVDGWRQEDTLREATKIVATIFLQPISGDRSQRHAVVLLSENSKEFIVCSMYPVDLSPVHYSKGEWERCQG